MQGDDGGADVERGGPTSKADWVKVRTLEAVHAEPAGAACEHERDRRDQGLSDHAAMWAQLTPTGRGAGAARG
jgi:hypothetical protein